MPLKQEIDYRIIFPKTSIIVFTIRRVILLNNSTNIKQEKHNLNSPPIMTFTAIKNRLKAISSLYTGATSFQKIETYHASVYYTLTSFQAHLWTFLSRKPRNKNFVSCCNFK